MTDLNACLCCKSMSDGFVFTTKLLNADAFLGQKIMWTSILHMKKDTMDYIYEKIFNPQDIVYSFGQK